MKHLVSIANAEKKALETSAEVMRKTGNFPRIGAVDVIFILLFLEKLGIIELTD